jgi:hypothetical protein
MQMKFHGYKALAAVALAGASIGAVGFATAGASSTQPARPEQATKVFRADLKSLNDSGASGVADLRLRGNVLDVHIRASGLVPNRVHAQHIHGVGNSDCPPPRAAGADGVLSTADGLPFYGPIVMSLTTSGDTSPAAGLTIELMPVADASGCIDYRRTIQLPDAVAADLSAFQIVQHGVDFNENGEYDFSAGPSELDPSLPQEATAPADCGTIDAHNAEHTH